MKTRFLSLLMVPALLLVACKGQKIGEDKAKEIANKIAENTSSLDGAGFEMKLTMKGSEGKGSEKEESDVTYVLTQDKDENMKFKMKGTEGDQKYDYVIYVVKNATYEEVAYIKEYNVETKEYTERVYTKATDDDYSSMTSSYVLNALGPAVVIAALADPVSLMESEDFIEGESEEDGLTYNTKIGYYSTGEKNLTIEAERKYIKGEIADDDEVATEAKYTITYDNLLFKKAVITGKSNIGNNSSMNASLELKKAAIELPSGWEKLVNK